MNEALKQWAQKNDVSGRWIDNGDGNVLPAHGPITSGMPRDLARQAAEALGLDMEDIRTMSRDKLVEMIKAKL